MSGTTRTPLEAGREAISRYEWREGFELLSEADASEGLAPDDLERMAEAAWWTARLEECISARERAFAAYMDAGNVRRAAIVAIALVKDYYAKGSSSIGSAWVKRAERLLADTPVCVEQGWLHRIQGVIALEGRGDYDAALHEARRSHELAARFGDTDLAAVSLHDEGRALVMQGDVAGGMALIDEATAPAISGELTPYTTGVIYCNTITACKDLADYRRAGDWTEAAKRWCDRQAIAGFPGMCRVYRASIMMVRGAWAEAELEARRACEELGAFNLSYAAEAFYELGEIRMRAGDHGAAEEAFKQAHELGREPQPGLALLRLAQGRVDSASSCIEEALEHESGDLHRSRLLPAHVAVALATDDRATARTATEELEAIATRFGSDALKAAAAATRAQLALAENDTRTAAHAARHALRLWQAIDAPYEAANARLLLGEAYLVRGDGEDAALEFEAALSVFERLGAALDARRAREQLDGARRAAGRGSGGPAKRTFMFTDVVRSTDLVAAIGDDAWTDVVGWHDRTLRTLFEEHGGEEIDHAGDGFFVAFEDPRTAVESAVAIQRRLAEHRREHGFAPQVRIGLHASEAARDRGAYRGRGVHEAARISALAGADEIVASTDTVRANPPRFPVSTPRTVELKGIPAPVEVVSVDWR